MACIAAPIERAIEPRSILGGNGAGTNADAFSNVGMSAPVVGSVKSEASIGVSPIMASREL